MISHAKVQLPERTGIKKMFPPLNKTELSRVKSVKFGTKDKVRWKSSTNYYIGLLASK